MADAFAAQTVVDPVAELVGEDKKFKTVTDLAKGKVEADNFIEQMKRENAQLREELAKRDTVQTELDALRNEVKTMKVATPAQPRENTTPALSESALRALVEQTITQSELQKTTAQNITEANNQLIRQFGSLDKAQEAVKSTAATLKVSVESLKRTASESPSAFLKLMGVATPAANQPLSVNGSVNTSAPNFQGGVGQPKEGTKEFYDAKYKDPKSGRYTSNYWDPKVQNAIMKAAMEGTYVTE